MPKAIHEMSDEEFSTYIVEKSFRREALADGEALKKFILSSLKECRSTGMNADEARAYTLECLMLAIAKESAKRRSE